jgi:hypothetical protein
MKKTLQDYIADLILLPCCLDHARVWQETHGGKYPPSNHSPGCKFYRPLRFLRLKMMDGAILIATPENGQAIAKEFNRDCQGGELVAEILGEILLTPDQVEKMPEYEP